VRYSIEQYDANGFLKAPKWLWLGWFFLSKAWIVFVMAGASRDSGPKILGLIYPDHSMLYLGLAMGVPSIVMMWLVGLRHPDRRWAILSAKWGREVTLLTTLAQFVQTGYHVYLQHGSFSWISALSMLLLLWFALYVYNSRSVRDCFQVPVLYRT
jgi:hypothetical protein